MKLKDLLEVVDPMQDITLEIAELTAPEGIYAKDIQKLRPMALELEVEDVHTAWYSEEGVYYGLDFEPVVEEDNIKTTLVIVVTGGKK